MEEQQIFVTEQKARANHTIYVFIVSFAFYNFSQFFFFSVHLQPQCFSPKIFIYLFASYILCDCCAEIWNAPAIRFVWTKARSSDMQTKHSTDYFGAGVEGQGWKWNFKQLDYFNVSLLLSKYISIGIWDIVSHLFKIWCGSLVHIKNWIIKKQPRNKIIQPFHQHHRYIFYYNCVNIILQRKHLKSCKPCHIQKRAIHSVFIKYLPMLVLAR